MTSTIATKGTLGWPEYEEESKTIPGKIHT
jgi:hypothetical protein